MPKAETRVESPMGRSLWTLYFGMVAACVHRLRMRVADCTRIRLGLSRRLIRVFTLSIIDQAIIMGMTNRLGGARRFPDNYRELER